MALCRAATAAVLLLHLFSLGLAAGVPVQSPVEQLVQQPVRRRGEPADIPPVGPSSYIAFPDRRHAGADIMSRLEPLLERALAGAVERVLAAGHRADGDDLAGLRARLEALERELAELRRGAPPPPPPLITRCSELPERLENGTESGPESETALQPTPQPEPEPRCESRPEPLAAELAPFERPETLACSRSCLQLRNDVGTPQDGVYWFTGMPVPTLCDFSHDGGGWTLLLTGKSRDGWNLLSVLGRRKTSPSLEDNYSILEHADAIRDLGEGDRFAYRIETQADKGRQRWGGVWFAPRDYSFVHEKPDQTEVFSVKRFDKWTYKTNGIKRRMPWLNMHVRGAGNQPAVLTTGDASNNVWGTLLNDEGTTTYQHSPWIHPEAQQSGTVLYWVREDSR